MAKIKLGELLSPLMDETLKSLISQSRDKEKKMKGSLSLRIVRLVDFHTKTREQVTKVFAPIQEEREPFKERIQAMQAKMQAAHQEGEEAVKKLVESDEFKAIDQDPVLIDIATRERKLNEDVSQQEEEIPDNVTFTEADLDFLELSVDEAQLFMKFIR